MVCTLQSRQTWKELIVSHRFPPNFNLPIKKSIFRGSFVKQKSAAVCGPLDGVQVCHLRGIVNSSHTGSTKKQPLLRQVALAGWSPRFKLQPHWNTVRKTWKIFRHNGNAEKTCVERANHSSNQGAWIKNVLASNQIAKSALSSTSHPKHHHLKGRSELDAPYGLWP